MGSIIKIVHFFASIIYLFISLYVVVCIPMIFGYKPLVVLSGSMEPTYKVGSVIYYKNVSIKELKNNDVIAFYNNKKEIVSHRIISINDDGIETKGDANNVNDPNKIRHDDVVGKVHKASLLYVGYYIKTVNDNLILFVTISVVILVLDFVIGNFFKNEFNNKEKKV